jgi:two-component system sensor histidine kinase/response regulator
MPGMDGFATTAAIRALPGGAELPIVALTAHAMAGDRERCLAAGMDDYVAKPILPSALAECLQRWIPRYASGEDGTPPPGGRAPGAARGDPGALAALERLGAQLGGFLLEDGLSRTGGDAGRLQALLQMFVQLHGDGARHLQDDAPVAEQQYEAHRIGGSAVMVGLVVLGERAAQFERLLGAGEPGAAAPPAEALARARRELLGALERSLAAMQECLGADAPGN